MSAPKFTLGPWVHCTDGHPSPDVRAKSGRAIAHTWNVCSNTPKTAAGYQARQEEDRANARLIAAAPELYEALDALSLIVGLTAFKHEAQRWALQEALDVARAALAKARGEA